jgi:hypothetical protein
MKQWSGTWKHIPLRPAPANHVPACIQPFGRFGGAVRKSRYPVVFLAEAPISRRNQTQELRMNRNGLYLVIALLAVAVVGLGIYVYQEETKPGVEIKIGQDGVSVQEN